jgi:cysteine-rich repeat protein
VPASCADEVLNGDETDVNCGGACEPCADGETCEQGSDCASGVCAEPVDDSGMAGTAGAGGGDLECQAPTCLDGIRNGFEADVDCGGSDCDPCRNGATCRAPADCASRVCTDDECVPAECGDGVANGTEHCDDGGPSATCDADCTFAVCRDGTTNTAAGEACDDGNRATEACAYGQTSCTVCAANCQTVAGATSFCGDGALDSAAGETCDDGNLVTESCAYGQTSCTVCNSSCNEQPGATAYCGDGTLNGSEQCDNGVNNGTGCHPDCTRALRARVLLHCDPSSAVLQTLQSTAGCYNLSATAFAQGPSYILLDSGTHATIYQGTNCTGTSANLTQNANFCNIGGMNDNVRSVRLGAAP